MAVIMKKEQQEDFVLNENLSTTKEEKPKGKDADYYTRILVAFTFAASALLILFNVVTGFFPVKSVIQIQSTASLSSSTTSPLVTSSASQEQQAGVVYWTAGGSVYHLRRDCSTLARSTDILSGSVDSAHKAGKANACKKCGGS